MSSLSILMALYECNSPVTDHWWIPLTKASNVISVILHTKLLHCKILSGLLWPVPRPTDVCQSILTLTTRCHLATGKREPWDWYHEPPHRPAGTPGAIYKSRDDDLVCTCFPRVELGAVGIFLSAWMICFAVHVIVHIDQSFCSLKIVGDE